MRLVIGVVVFSIVVLSMFGLLNSVTDWPIEVIVICSLLTGGMAEWLFYKVRRK